MDTLSVTVEFLDTYIKKHDFDARPLIVGVSGPQGSGKLYLSSHLQKILSERYPQYKTIQFLIDDLYLTHDDQKHLTLSTTNPLLQGRGVPGTHDLQLANSLFESIVKRTHPLHLPIYDKLRFNGEGDRSEKTVTIDLSADIVVFEGWFNGYMPLDENQIKFSYFQHPDLWVFKLFELEEINKYLVQYKQIWQQFDMLVNILADNITENVLRWRTQQEHHLISLRGVGMSDEQVVTFLQRYMPMYTLYYENLCHCNDRPTLQLHIDIERKLCSYSIKDGTQHQNL